MTKNTARAANTLAQAHRLMTKCHDIFRALRLAQSPALPNLLATPSGRTSLMVASTALFSLPVFAQTVPLGTASSYGVLAASAITSTGFTVIAGDLGITPNNASSVTGFSFSTPPGPAMVIGATHFADAQAVTAKNDAQTAYNTLADPTQRPCTTTISADLGGTTLTPGVYCSTSSMGLTGTLTLDAQNNPNAVFIFKAGSTLTTASASQVRIINGGSSCNVFWQIGSSATMGTGSSFLGNVLASSSITMTTGTRSTGRLIALNGAVTLDGSGVTVCSLASASATPLVSKAFSPATINPGATSVLNITLINPNLSAATLIQPFTDSLPANVVVANSPNVSTTCVGGSPSALAGTNLVMLSGPAQIPANGFCSLSVSVTSTIAATYVNRVPINALVTSNGNNGAEAVATLFVVPFVSISTSAIPTLSTWALLMSGLLLLVIGVMAQRRRIL